MLECKMKRIGQQEHEARYKLWLEGYGDGEIAKELFVSRTSINRWRRVHGLAVNTYSTKISRTEHNRRMEMLKAGYSDRKAASLLGINRNSFITWRVKRGIRRGTGEGNSKCHTQIS